MSLITGIHHVNLVVPRDTLDAAHAFYADTLGFVSVPVPERQRGTLAWFNVSDSSQQQVHIAFGRDFDFAGDATTSSRHPCFKVASPAALRTLQQRIWAHYSATGSSGAPRACDEPGEEPSGAKGVEYPSRFFVRDYAGNRLEFSL